MMDNSDKGFNLIDRFFLCLMVFGKLWLWHWMLVGYFSDALHAKISQLVRKKRKITLTTVHLGRIVNSTSHIRDDDFNFCIMKVPPLNSNILSVPAYDIFISQLTHDTRSSSSYKYFILKAHNLLISNWRRDMWWNTWKLHGRCRDLVKYHGPQDSSECLKCLTTSWSWIFIIFLSVVPAQIRSLVGEADKGKWLGGMVAAGAGMALINLVYFTHGESYWVCAPTVNKKFEL